MTSPGHPVAHINFIERTSTICLLFLYMRNTSFPQLLVMLYISHWGYLIVAAEKRMMASDIVALSFIIISACCAAPLHNDCSIMSGWDEDGRELSKEDIQYCLINDCVIRRMDTSEELDIMDVGNDTIITVARGNHTSTLISLLPNEEYCQQVDDDDKLDHVHSVEATILLATKALLLVSTIILSLYIIAVYMLWDKLRSSISKLLVIHNSLSAADKLFLLILMVFHTVIKTTSPFCQVIIYTDLYFKLSNKVSISIIFVHIAYLLYQSRYQRFEISASWTKNLLRFYTLTSFTVMIPMICFIALLDIFSGSGHDTVSSDGHCIIPPVTSYSTLTHLYGYSFPSALVQIIAFILIVIHYKHLYNPLTGSIADAPIVIGEPKVGLLIGLASIMMVYVFSYNISWFIMITFLRDSYIVSLFLDLAASLIEVGHQSVIAIKLTMLKLNDLPKQFCV